MFEKLYYSQYWRWGTSGKNRIEKGYMSCKVTKCTFGCTPSVDSDEPAHSYSLISIFDGCSFDSQGCNVS